VFWAPSKTKGPQSCQPIGGIDLDWIMHYAFTVLAVLDRDEAMPNAAGALCRNAPRGAGRRDAVLVDRVEALVDVALGRARLPARHRYRISEITGIGR
jgi:hypothetical protein